MMKKTNTKTAAALALLFAATFALGYYPEHRARTQEREQIVERIQHIHGEGDAGMIITDYITTGHTSDYMGQKMTPAQFWQLIEAITYPCTK